MWVNAVIAFFLSLLSGLGIGGGGLFAVYLALASDIPQLAVQGLNLLFFLFSAGASVTLQLFRRKIMFFAVGVMVAAGVVGVFAGTFLSGVIKGEYLRKIFGIMLVSGGIISLKQSLSYGYAKNLSSDKNKRMQAASDSDTNVRK